MGKEIFFSGHEVEPTNRKTAPKRQRVGITQTSNTYFFLFSHSSLCSHEDLETSNLVVCDNVRQCSTVSSRQAPTLGVHSLSLAAAGPDRQRMDFDKGGEVDGGEVASDLGRGLRRPRADLRGWRRRGRRILQVTLCILCASVKLITLLSLQQFSNSTCPQFSVGCDVSVWPTACRRAECRSGGCDVSVLATAHALAKRRSGGCGSSVWPTTVGRAKRRTGECDVCVWAATVGRAACRSGGSDVSGKHEHRQTVQ